MSHEAHLAEVRANLPISLTIKAADALFSQEQRTYTAIPTEMSHRGGEGHKKRHDSHKKSISEKKDDKKSSRNKKRNQRSTSGENEVATLRAEIAELHEDNASIRKELDDLRRLVQKSQPMDWVLILGDGQLSFSHAFALKHPDAHVTATVLEDEKSFLKRYPTGRQFITKLEKMSSRVRLKFGVDATRLTKDFVRNFRVIIMNFPHPGGKNNTKANRELLFRIFKCLRDVLRSRTEFRLTLRASQIGLNLGDDLESATCSEPPPHQSDSWRAVQLAADNEMFLDSIERFQELEGYQTSGYKNSDKFFHNDNALTLSFCKVSAPSNLEEAKCLESKKRHSRFCRLHPFFVRDISILYRDRNFKQEDEDFMLDYVRRLCGKLLVKIEELREIRCIYNERHNRMYRLYWQSCTFPLSRSLFNKFHTTLTVGDTSVTCQKAEAPKKEETPAKEEDFDLFGSDDDEEESAEAKAVREKRLADYAAKKSKKPGPIAKSSVILDVKPWDDETNLDEMEKTVKSIQMDGLLWGATKKVPIGYGISKLQIVCTVEDEKVSVDDLTEKIQEFEDFVQSVDIVAFNKI